MASLDEGRLLFLPDMCMFTPVTSLLVLMYSLTKNSSQSYHSLIGTCVIHVANHSTVLDVVLIKHRLILTQFRTQSRLY